MKNDPTTLLGALREARDQRCSVTFRPYGQYGWSISGRKTLSSGHDAMSTKVVDGLTLEQFTVGEDVLLGDAVKRISTDLRYLKDSGE